MTVNVQMAAYSVPTICFLAAAATRTTCTGNRRGWSVDSVSPSDSPGSKQEGIRFSSLHYSGSILLFLPFVAVRTGGFQPSSLCQILKMQDQTQAFESKLEEAGSENLIS